MKVFLYNRKINFTPLIIGVMFFTFHLLIYTESSLWIFALIILIMTPIYALKNAEIKNKTGKFLIKIGLMFIILFSSVLVLIVVSFGGSVGG